MISLEQTFTLLVVAAALAAALWLLRRHGLAVPKFQTSRRDTRRQLEALERLPLGAQHALHLVRVADQIVLVGVSPSSCHLVAGSLRLEREPGERALNTV